MSTPLQRAKELKSLISQYQAELSDIYSELHIGKDIQQSQVIRSYTTANKLYDYINLPKWHTAKEQRFVSWDNLDIGNTGWMSYVGNVQQNKAATTCVKWVNGRTWQGALRDNIYHLKTESNNYNYPYTVQKSFLPVIVY